MEVVSSSIARYGSLLGDAVCCHRYILTSLTSFINIFDKLDFTNFDILEFDVVTPTHHFHFNVWFGCLFGILISQAHTSF